MWNRSYLILETMNDTSNINKSESRTLDSCDLNQCPLDMFKGICGQVSFGCTCSLRIPNTCLFIFSSMIVHCTSIFFHKNIKRILSNVQSMLLEIAIKTVLKSMNTWKDMMFLLESGTKSYLQWCKVWKSLMMNLLKLTFKILPKVCHMQTFKFQGHFVVAE